MRIYTIKERVRLTLVGSMGCHDGGNMVGRSSNEEGEGALAIQNQP
jgi:hypothetical protein